MTSTEFTCGLGEGSRISSKVLKPPGGGSSDIFGLGDSSDANKSAADKKAPETTRTRLFGDPSDPLPPTPNKNTSLHRSTIFQNNDQPPPAPVSTRAKKVHVVRNPITGEEIEINAESGNEDKNEPEKEVVKEEEAAPPNVPSNKPVQTSIRVRNPPGGKSSGIF